RNVTGVQTCALPILIGALRRAREIGVQTILLTCNAKREPGGEFDLEINLKTGPEIVTGSTRLKAGTATKIALNIISTGAMTRLEIGRASCRERVWDR